MTSPVPPAAPEGVADDRTVNSEGAPFGPILRDMLHVESDRLRASYSEDERDEVLRLAVVLDMASDYIAAVVEGKGPASDALLSRLAAAEGALKWIAAQSCRRDAPCFELNACVTERCETCYARAAQAKQ